MQRPCGSQPYSKYKGLKEGQCIWSEGSEAECGERCSLVDHGKGMSFYPEFVGFVPRIYLQRQWALEDSCGTELWRQGHPPDLSLAPMWLFLPPQLSGTGPC